jgi:hypothetical protein
MILEVVCVGDPERIDRVSVGIVLIGAQPVMAS